MCQLRCTLLNKRWRPGPKGALWDEEAGGRYRRLGAWWRYKKGAHAKTQLTITGRQLIANLLCSLLMPAIRRRSPSPNARFRALTRRSLKTNAGRLLATNYQPENIHWDATYCYYPLISYLFLFVTYCYYLLNHALNLLLFLTYSYILLLQLPPFEWWLTLPACW